MPSKKKKIGYLGGTFDPLHNGHIHLALSLQERWGLDEIWFNPAACSPFKIDRPPHTSYTHRYQMLKLALKNYPHFRVLDLEKGAISPVFTIDAILSLFAKEKIEQDNLYLLLAEDALLHFNHWKEAKQLALLTHPIIGMRRHIASPEELLRPFEKDQVLYERFKKGLTLMPILEISSTIIRERLRKQMPCGHLLPQEVCKYIEEEKLYFGNGEQQHHFEKQTIWL